MDDKTDTRGSVLTLTEASRFIRVSEKTLGAMARDGRIPAQKVGREWRFFQPALEEWLKGKPETK
jgi:excisionase family DNA binding protein